RAQQLLLVLDNCEHLIGACAELANRLLHAAPWLRVLATSREPLGIVGEVAWRVSTLALPSDPGLSTPSADRLTALVACAAVRLFDERARAVMPSFAVTNHNSRAVAQVCTYLDGIPLALELAAVRVPALGLEQLARRLDDRFHLLTGGSRAALPRQ